MFKRLIELANKLDKKGFYKEANEIDMLLKRADIFEWFAGKSKKDAKCICKCEGCEYAKLPRGPDTHHCGIQEKGCAVPKK